jgi:hypothetical protein
VSKDRQRIINHFRALLLCGVEHPKRGHEGFIEGRIFAHHHHSCLIKPYPLSLLGDANGLT